MKGKYIFLLIIALLTNFIAQPIIWSMQEQDTVEEVNCYDRYRNEIQGLVCEEKRYAVPIMVKIIISFVTIFISFLLPFGIYPGDSSL